MSRNQQYNFDYEIGMLGIQIIDNSIRDHKLPKLSNDIEWTLPHIGPKQKKMSKLRYTNQKG